MVNMWTRVRHPKELLAVVVQVSHRVKAGLLQLNSTTPFVDTDAYVASSDVSRIEGVTHLYSRLLNLCFAERPQSR